MTFMLERLVGMLLGYGMLSRQRRPLCQMLMTALSIGNNFHLDLLLARFQLPNLLMALFLLSGKVSLEGG